MKLKQRSGDFRVRELLKEGFLTTKGPHRVYRVIKRKMTTPEAVRIVANLAGVQLTDVSIAGLKDRQGITSQYVSVPRGRDVTIQEKELKVDSAGFSAEPVSSAASRGNAFEIGVRALSGPDVERLRANLPGMRMHGVVNYFDDQRFGNLEFAQGWILLDLIRGGYEKALRTLLTASSNRDDDHHMRFKRALDGAWGNWHGCRDIAGKFGAHHSIFEHLARHSGDFAGAFEHVSTRIKTIHLFAFQSHLWNRAVAAWIRSLLEVQQRVAMRSIEGSLISWADERPPVLRDGTFPLPGPGLDDVRDEKAYALLEDVLAELRLVPDQLRVEGMRGFHLKGEQRALAVVPEHLRVRPAERDVLNPGLRMVRVRFDLPRGAYATLVVKRLLARKVGEESAEEKPTASVHNFGRGREFDARRPQNRPVGGGRDGSPWRRSTEKRSGNRAQPYSGASGRGSAWKTRSGVKDRRPAGKQASVEAWEQATERRKRRTENTRGDRSRKTR